MAGGFKSIDEILDALDAQARARARVSLGDAIEALGHRSYGPFLLLPALIDISPIGAIPGLPTLLALIIVLVAIQMVFGRTHLWLPQWLQRRALDCATVIKTIEKARKPGRWADRWFHGRLPALTRGPFARAAGLACILLALSVPPLELLPLATTVPMATIALVGLALAVHDGALMIAALVLGCGGAIVGAGLLVSQG